MLACQKTNSRKRMNKTKKKGKIAELERKIELCRAFKEISKNNAHYDPLIRKYSSDIEKRKSRANLLKNINKFAIPPILIIAMLAVLVFYKPSFTGYFAFEEKDADSLFASSEIPTQLKAEINKPVKWIKMLSAENNETVEKTISVCFSVPEDAANVNIKDAKLDKKSIKLKQENWFFRIFIKSKDKELEFDDILWANETKEYVVEYETSAPVAVETEINDYKKQIIVSSDTHYENILAYTSVRESPQELIKLYWLINDSRELVNDVSYIDTNNNGLIDRLEWIVPSLSSQTYEVIIEISKAEHLDENHSFVSDIYDDVISLDNIWSEPVYHDEYVRVTFERNLTSDRDITVYARNNQSLNTTIEVYYYNSSEKITEFPIITDEKYYKVYLTDMSGSHDTFDLKVKNLDDNSNAYLEFDHIIDPVYTNTTIFNDGFETDITTNWTVTWTVAGEEWIRDNDIISQEGSWHAHLDTKSDPSELISKQMDTSGANVKAVYVEFAYQDDDCDTGDLILYFNDTAGNWVNMVDLSAIGTDDVWINYTMSTTSSDYFHPGFAVRFYNPLALAATENFWVDDVRIIKQEGFAPTYSGAAENDSEIFVGESVNHSITISNSPDGYIFSWNGTNNCAGGWSNSSFVDVSGASVTGHNISTIGIGCGGKTIGWRFYANNSAGWNGSTLQNYYVYDYETGRIGYELLDNNKVVHIWNVHDDYYFNASSGIQFTNHFQEYWTRNIFCAGYKDAQNEWMHFLLTGT